MASPKEDKPLFIWNQSDGTFLPRKKPKIKKNRNKHLKRNVQQDLENTLMDMQE